MPEAATKTDSLPAIREQPPRLEGERRPRSKLRRIGSWFVSPDSTALVYLGLAVAMLGFAALAFTWSKVAATLSVPLQIPYLASGGFVGLGLVIVGVVIANIAVKRRDNFARIRQLQKLSATMESIELAVAEPPTGSDGDGS
ncbi:MAG: hypothetical protein ACRDKT_05745 [Actinomycetota bacterium]